MRHYRLGAGKWVFVDWMGIEPGYGTAWGGAITDGYCIPEGVALKVHRPKVRPEPILAAEKPWESRGINDCAFLHDGGRFRCWYTTMIPSDHPKFKIALRLAYAESDDGIAWRRIPLGQRDHDGVADNNLILVDGPFPNLSGHIFLDPSAGAEARYKMVGPGGKVGVIAAVSPDGLRWKGLPEPILPQNNSDTDNCCEFLPELGKYVLFTRQKDGVMQRRGINRAESADFAHFPPSVPVVESNPLDPPHWDYYSNAFCSWPGAVDAYVMRIGLFRRTADVVETHLATSRDAWLWHRPLGREPWLAPDFDPVQPYRQIYACHGILPTAPGEWSLYLTAWRMGHNELDQKLDSLRPVVLRTTLREDGFTSLSAEGHGQFWTIPFKCDSDAIHVNVQPRYSGYLKCEIVEAAIVGGTGHSVTIGDAAAGFTLADCDPIVGDHVRALITWKGSPDISRFKGREIRLRFSLYKADLYSLQF